MDNAKKLSPVFQASVLAADNRWLQGAEKSGFGTGLTRGVAIAIRGRSLKRSGTVPGKTSFPLIGKRSALERER
jgi:hypothetical protein